MGMYPDDYEREMADDAMYDSFRENVLEDEEVYDRIVESFKEIRLIDYYLEHPGVIECPYGMLDEARNLLTIHPRASFVFAASSGEVGLNFGILAPILHGCFHSESAADLLVEVIIKEKKDNLTKALLKVLNHFTGINVLTFVRSGGRDNLWKELADIRKLRNRILHHAESADHQQAERAILISETILNDVLTEVLKKLGLHLHAGTQICGSAACPSSPKKSSS